MTSNRPPRLRDTTSPLDRIRQDRLNLLTAGGVGFMRGGSPLPRQRGATAAFTEADNAGDTAAAQDQPRFWTDVAVVPAAGDLQILLTYPPLDHSIHVKWGGVPQHPDVDWTISGQVLTLADPGFEINDKVWVYYSYVDAGEQAEADVATLVAYGSPGWAHKQVALADSTDYSAATYDDSSWATDRTPFGNNTVLGNPATNWDQDTSIWLRRTILHATDITITVKVEDNCKVYVNGTLVGTATPASPGSTHPWFDDPFVVDVPNSVLTASPPVVAIRCNDDVVTYPDPDNVYVDVKITGRPA